MEAWKGFCLDGMVEEEGMHGAFCFILFCFALGICFVFRMYEVRGGAVGEGEKGKGGKGREGGRGGVVDLLVG